MQAEMTWEQIVFWLLRKRDKPTTGFQKRLYIDWVEYELVVRHFQIPRDKIVEQINLYYEEGE